MKKLFILGALLALVVACADSASETKKDSAKDTVKACKPLNPNGDSELAILMRAMAGWNDSIKAALLSGREAPAPPSNLNDIITAKRTDPNIDAAVFNSHASHYLAQVEQFKSAAKEDKTRTYNAIVNACVSCHENFCGGPLVRINKMFIAEKK